MVQKGIGTETERGHASHARAIIREKDVRTRAAVFAPSQLNQWPVKIELAPIKAAFFNEAKLLIAADCTAYAYASFHKVLMKGKITLIGCPKMNETDYAKKLTAILRENDIASVTIARMEVPCCSGIEIAVRQALRGCSKPIPWRVITLSTDGEIVVK